MAGPSERRSSVTGSPADALGEANDRRDSKTSKELTRLRAALAQLTDMVNELARQLRDKGAG